MKRRIARQLLALLLLLAVGLFIIACGKTETNGKPTDTVPTQAGDETTDHGTAGTRLTLSSGILSDYILVKPADASKGLSSAVDDLQKALSDATGARFRVTEDYGEGDPADDVKEIVIGNCSRSAAQALLRELRYKDYRISLQKDTILAVAHDDETAVKATQKLIRMLKGNIEKSENRSELVWAGDYTYSAMSYKLADISLHRTSLQEYTIVYSAEDSMGKTNAIKLRDQIGSLSGFVLEIASDKTPERRYEILIGKTNRTDKAYEAFALQAMEYALVTEGDKILIAGAYPFSTQKAIEAFGAYVLSTKNGIVDGMSQKVSLLKDAVFEANSADLRIMEYNVLVEFPGWGAGGSIPPEVELRKEIIAEVINGYKPDVFCLCEFFENWRKQLPPLLDSCYRFVAIDRPDGSSNRNSIVYNADRLNLIDGGYENISLWENDNNKRIVMWGLFEEKANGKQFLVLGTHYASEPGTQGESWRLQQVDLTLKLLERLTEQYRVPVILMGDLNCVKGQSPYDRLIDRTGFSDAMGGKAEVFVDHILYDPAGLKLGKTIIEKEKMTAIASDHSPVIADFYFTN